MTTSLKDDARCVPMSLFIGGDKSSQQEDIVKEKKLNQEYERW